MEYFAVKNFEKFQHYTDRRPIWIKLYNSILDDYEFGKLPDPSKFHLIAIYLLASRYNNVIPLDPAWIKRVIGSDKQVDLRPLFESGFLFMIDGLEDDSKLVADCYQGAILEKRREEKNREEKSVDFRDDIWDWVRKNYDAPKGRTVWKSARETWCKTIKKGAKPEDLGRAIHHYQQSTSREFRIGLQRFLNTKEPWREWVDGPEVKSDGLPPAVNADDLEVE